MLDLDSETRVTAEDALAHSYLAQYSDPNDEPTAAPFDQSFENMELSISEWRSKYLTILKKENQFDQFYGSY